MKKTLLSVAVYTAMSVSAAYAADGHDHGGGMANNPSITVDLEARYGAQDDAHFELSPAFQAGGGEGVFETGFSTGHSAINVLSQVSPHVSGAFHLGIMSGEETSVHVEEAYLTSTVLGSGIAVKMGRFPSAIGILNSVHGHHQDFATAPLVYLGLFGGSLVDTGVQASWGMNAGVNVKLGFEATTGESFPGGSNEDNINGFSLFAKLGGKVGNNGSWGAGASFYSSTWDSREAGGHAHGAAATTGGPELHITDGDTTVAGFDLAYSMSPNGKGKAGEFSLQMEYFVRDETADLHYDADGTGVNMVMGDYEGSHTGYYVQALYSFMPSWRVGLRWDSLEADNDLNVTATGTAVEDDTEMHAHDPATRTTLMLDVNTSAKSKVRLQYMSDETSHTGEAEDRIYVQFLATLGGSGHSSHGGGHGGHGAGHH